MNDMTAAETTTGLLVLVELDEAARMVVFRDDETEAAIAGYAFETFAEVTGALALNVGENIILSAGTIADVQQWANLDAHGLRIREGN
jgi:hypothetical protein